MSVMPRSLAALLVFSLFLCLPLVPAGAAPSGPPVRIGGTLALTGPLAPTALLHKIAGEVYVEWLNQRNGLLGRPVEWCCWTTSRSPT